MGVAELIEEESLIKINAHLYFYGDAASEPLSHQIAADINSQWNIQGGHVTINGKDYKLQFDLKGFYAPRLQQHEVNENDNPLNNYFRVEEFASGNISFVDAIESNTGYFKLDNLLNGSTTAAHEFGHTLGLMHPDHHDIRGHGVPRIMYPRGTITDPAYQYDPSARPHAPGGTMNPAHRRVTQHDIDNLHLEKLNFDDSHSAVVGAFSSEWHYPHTPDFISGNQ